MEGEEEACSQDYPICEKLLASFYVLDLYHHRNAALMAFFRTLQPPARTGSGGRSREPASVRKAQKLEIVRK
jgi:hypothetical protein